MAKIWTDILSNSIRDAKGIQVFLNLPEEEAKEMEAIVEKYPLCVNPYYLSLIDKEDPNDPIRKMSIPDLREFSEGGQADTSGESENTVIQGMQHKYAQTALILSTNQCAMYCRHCFRKRMVGASADEIALHLPEMAEYVRRHVEINNVLISGGDAFLNSNETIETYLRYFSDISTLDFIRFGTRTPVVLPQRISEDEELQNILHSYGKKKQIIIVTQFNHPRELTKEAVRALDCLREVGCIIRNQTVLLKGVNDDPFILSDLMNKLVACGVIPYYIFQCRPVVGVKNQFQVPILDGIKIVDAAKNLMNGQSKGVRYAMSHPTGKIEIIGCLNGNEVIFKYHQAKYEQDRARIFVEQLERAQSWL